MPFFGVLILFIFGAAMGSFVNVIALRYNTGLSFLKGKSVCLSCGKALLWHELIPIISFLRLKGCCSGCHTRLSIQYLLIEIFSGLAFAWLFFKFGLSLDFILLSIIYCLLSIIFIYDLRHKIIPDSFVLLFIIFSFVFSIIHNSYSIIQILLPALLIPLPFVFLWLFSQGRLMGLGDAKFMVGMGLLLGIEKAISAVLLSFWIGAVFVLILYLYNKFFKKSYNSHMNIGMKSEIPFAPFLVVSTVIEFFFNIDLLHINLL